jgi:hypothetical protein
MERLRKSRADCWGRRYGKQGGLVSPWKGSPHDIAQMDSGIAVRRASRHAAHVKLGLATTGLPSTVHKI